jgi:LysR family hydrogen peroxide-inducible transcriptional activator
MSSLNNKLPKINFFLYEDQTENLLQQLDQGKLDILILPYLDQMAKFDSFELFDEPLLLATPTAHPLANKTALSLDDLQQQKILTLEDGHCLKEQTMGYCFAAGANEDTSFQATSLETLRHMVASGIGITMLPALSTLEQFNNDHIRYSQFAEPQPTRSISLVVRPNYSRMQCVRAIVAQIRQSIASVLSS